MSTLEANLELLSTIPEGKLQFEFAGIHCSGRLITQAYLDCPRH